MCSSFEIVKYMVSQIECEAKTLWMNIGFGSLKVLILSFISTAYFVWFDTDLETLAKS